jgi:septum formation inhibitor-activating ATPase MinD
MENSAMGLDGIRLSAITKASVVSSDVTEVTLGPNRKCASSSYEVDERNCLPVEDEFSVESHARNITCSNINLGIDNIGSTEMEDKYSRCIMKLMSEIRSQQQMGVKELMNKRFLEMEKDSRIHRLDRLEVERKCQDLKCEIEATVLYEEQLVLRKLQEDETLASQRQQQLAQEHRQHAQRINEQNEKLKEEEKRQKEAEENERKRMKERKIQLGRLHQYQVAYQTICEEIAKAAEQCKDEQAFVAKVSGYTTELNNLKEAMNQLITRCKPGEIRNSDLEDASRIIQQLQEILGVLREESQKINE